MLYTLYYLFIFKYLTSCMETPVFYVSIRTSDGLFLKISNMFLMYHYIWSNGKIFNLTLTMFVTCIP